jgi:hypothetical protein
MRVAQVVKAHSREAGVQQNLMEPVQNVGRVDGRADARRENQFLLLPGRVR